MARLDEDSPQAVEGLFQDCTIWVHDKPKSYKRIDEILEVLRTNLEGPVVQDGGIYAQWIGSSRDLADDERKTIVRNITFRFAGRR